MERNSLHLVSPVRLELLFSARDPADYSALAGDLAGLPEVPVDPAVTARAEEVQALLAGRSHHRGPTPVDLYVAAAAEVNGLTLVHYDRHFDAIVLVTGQPAEWIAPRGTLD
jgi:predicted nucleic acid-binding protein